MPQLQLPFFPEGSTQINAHLAVEKKDGNVTYFNGLMPVFIHAENDLATFRMITSQFCVNGNAKLVEISKTFGVPIGTVKRFTRLYREQGPQGFYQPRKRRGATVLTSSVLKIAQRLFDEGLSVPEVASELGIKKDTLRKAVSAGRLHCPTGLKKKSRVA